MSRPRKPVTALDVALAIAARVEGCLPVTAQDVAADLDICRRTMHDVLVREAGVGFAEFCRGYCTYLPADAESDADDGDMHELTALVTGPVADGVRRLAREQRTSPAMIAGRLLSSVLHGADGESAG